MHDPNHYSPEPTFLDVWISSTDSQRVRWSKLVDDHIYSFELISPLKAQQHSDARYKINKTNYIKFVAIVLEDSDEPKMNKDDIILLEIPVKTFSSALWDIPLADKKNLRPSILQDNNLKFIFKRKTYQLMDILKIKNVKIKPEHHEYIKRYYEVK